MKYYKVLLVDDEKYARLWIRNCVNWRELGFEIVGEATCGECAIQMACTLLPDLIVSDIEMQGGNGVELMVDARKSFPEALFVIISGYDKYEYVRSAVQNNAVDYLLKPVKDDDLRKVLLNVKDKLDCLQDEKEWVSRTFNENKSLLQEQVIIRLLTGALSTEELEKLTGRRESWLAAIIEVAEDAKQCIYKLEEEALKKGGVFLGMELDGEITCILGGDDDNIRSVLSACLDILPDVCAKTAIGGVKKEPGQISRSYAEAQLAKDTRESNNGKRVAVYSAEEILIPNVVTLEQEQRLLIAVRKMDKSSALDIVRGIFATGESCPQKNSYGKIAYMTLLSVLARYSVEIGIPLEQLGAYNIELFARASRIRDFELAGVASRALVEEIFDSIQDKNRSKGDCISQVKSYILANYSRDVSLDEIATHAGMTPNYLCAVFKNETAQSIFDFVSELRISKAKEMLLQRGNKVYEVSSAVGYSDSKYFGRVFKKVTGLSPGDYKSRYTNS